MSLLTVTGLTHGFGDRAIFNNVSFQLNRLDKVKYCRQIRNKILQMIIGYQ